MCSKIFSEKNFLYFFGKPKYKNENLKKLLQKLYGDKRLSDLKNKIIITASDFTLKQPRIFENIDLKKEQDLRLVDIGLCSSAAPTYFDPQEIIWSTLNYDIENIPINEKILLLSALEKNSAIANEFKKASVIFDGGILENIPIISTYATLRSNLGVEPKDIDMFVIGTGNFKNSKHFTVEQVNKWSSLKILNKLIIPYITDSNEQTSIFWGLQMGFNSFEMFNPIEINGSFDDPKKLEEIETKCLKYKDEFILKINEFLNK